MWESSQSACEVHQQSARDRVGRFHRDVEIARQLPRGPGLWTVLGLRLLRLTQRLEVWLIRRLPRDGEQVSPLDAGVTPLR